MNFHVFYHMKTDRTLANHARDDEAKCNTVLIIYSVPQKSSHIGFYRAMHFSAKRGIAIARRLSVRPSVCVSVTLVIT